MKMTSFTCSDGAARMTDLLQDNCTFGATQPVVYPSLFACLALGGTLINGLNYAYLP